MYWATDIGLINIHGHSFGSNVGIWSMSLRIDVPRPPLDIFRFKMPTAELEVASIVNEGMREANLLYNSFLLNS